MSEKNWGDTVVGWFIVKDGEETGQAQNEADLSADELIAKYADQTPLNAEGENAAVEIPATKQIPANYVTPPPAPEAKLILTRFSTAAELTRTSANGLPKQKLCSTVCPKEQMSRSKNKSSKPRSVRSACRSRKLSKRA